MGVVWAWGSHYWILGVPGISMNFPWRFHLFQRLSIDRHQCSSSWCTNSSSAYKAFLLASVLAACASSYGSEMRRKSTRFICTDSRVIRLELVVSWWLHRDVYYSILQYTVQYDMYAYTTVFTVPTANRASGLGWRGAINGYTALAHDHTVCWCLLYCHFCSLSFDAYMIAWYRERYCIWVYVFVDGPAAMVLTVDSVFVARPGA